LLAHVNIRTTAILLARQPTLSHHATTHTNTHSVEGPGAANCAVAPQCDADFTGFATQALQEGAPVAGQRLFGDAAAAAAAAAATATKSVSVVRLAAEDAASASAALGQEQAAAAAEAAAPAAALDFSSPRCASALYPL
jgi:hypothetical protein